MKGKRTKLVSFCCSCNANCRSSSQEKSSCSIVFIFVLITSFISIMKALHNNSSRQVVVLGLMTRQQQKPRVLLARHHSSNELFFRKCRHYGHGCPRRLIPSTLQHVRFFLAGPLLSKQQSNNNNDMATKLPTMELLTSKRSSTVKLFSSLLSNNRKKVRETNNLTVVEGYRLVLDILTNPTTTHLIQHLLVTEDALHHHPEFSPILQQYILLNNKKDKHVFRVNLVTENVMAACTDTVTPQGVVATCTIPDPFDYTTTVSREKINTSKTMPKLYLVLDGVSDPGNVGTLIRSSVACGVSAIFLLPGCVDPYSSKALRSAMGATFRIPLKSFSSTDECWDLLQNYCGVLKERIYAATLESVTTMLEQEQPQEEIVLSSSPMHTDIDWIANGSNGIGSAVTNSAIIIGREGSGLSPEIRNAVLIGQIGSVHVAMEGGMESLNAAVCGSVILFEYARQKREYARRRSKYSTDVII